MADEDDGLTIVLSPLQLAAVLGGHYISAHEMLMNRLWGGGQLVFSALQLIGGGALLLTPEPTMLTKVAGGVLAAHGVDSGVAGARQLWTGEPTRDLTSIAGEAAAKGLGASANTAYWTGVGLDVAVPLAAGAALGAARILAIRGGRISLLVEETVAGGPARGHTILEHVGKSEAELSARLAAKPRLTAASSFDSLEVAEQVVSDALKANKSAIEAWTKVAKIGDRQVFSYAGKSGSSIGYGIVRGSADISNMSNARIVLRLIAHNGNPFFVLTAYPVP